MTTTGTTLAGTTLADTAPTGNRAGVLSGSVGFASRAVVQLLLFGVTIVATRTLSIADFGAYAIGSLFLILARQLFYVGPYEYLLKSQDDGHLFSACFGANLVQAAVLALLLGAVWLAAPLLFPAGKVSLILGLLVPAILPVAAVAWYEAVLLRAMRVKRYYASLLVGDTLGAALAVFLLLHGWGVVALVAQTYARLFSVLVLLALATGQRPSLAAGPRAIREVLHWSRARHAAVLLNFTSAYGADLVLGVALSPAATGLYRASNRIVSALSDLFAQPLQKIAQTNLSASCVRRQDSGTAWLTMLSGVGAVAWSGLLTLACLAPDLVPFALGAKWAPAVPVVVVFCAVKAFALLDAVTTSFLVCHDRQRAMLKVQAASAVSVIGLAWFTARWGPQAVALAVGLTTAAMSLTYAAMVMRQSRADRHAVRALAWTSAPPVVAVGIGLALFEACAPPLAALPRIAAGLATAALSFFAGAFLVRHRIFDAIGSLGHLPAPSAREQPPPHGEPGLCAKDQTP